jgi:hypothetical protein
MAAYRLLQSDGKIWREQLRAIEFKSYR